MTPQRARWVLAEQPGREVTAVRDSEGHLWVRQPGEAEAEDVWTPPPTDPHLRLTWTTLLVEWGPLDEAEDPR